MDETLHFYHAAPSRSSGVHALLEELGVPYELHRLDLKAGDNRRPDYLAVNPLGKVPAIRHRGEVVTEQVAIFLYLADEYPAAGLAPAIGDPLRGPYLRWMAFYGSSFEPAVVDRATQREPAQQAMSPYGDFDSVLRVLTDRLAAGPWLLGERFTAADILWGGALGWTMGFGIVPGLPVLKDYAARVADRPGCRWAREADAA